MDVSNLNIIAIIAAAACAFVIGGMWYSPLLFGKSWQRLTGLTDDELSGSMGRVFGGAAALSLVISTNLAAFLGPTATLGFGVAAGAAAGLGWVACAFGITYLFERRPMKLFLINAGYHVVVFVVMGAILGAWSGGGAA